MDVVRHDVLLVERSPSRFLDPRSRGPRRSNRPSPRPSSAHSGSIARRSRTRGRVLRILSARTHRHACRRRTSRTRRRRAGTPNGSPGRASCRTQHRCRSGPRRRTIRPRGSTKPSVRAVSGSGRSGEFAASSIDPLLRPPSVADTPASPAATSSSLRVPSSAEPPQPLIAMPDPRLVTLRRVHDEAPAEVGWRHVRDGQKRRREVARRDQRGQLTYHEWPGRRGLESVE
jgi:hypothetical protein